MGKQNLDLHGVKHEKVYDLVENHILLTKTPFKIITGNSETMKKICIQVLEKYDFKFAINTINLGCIEVLA